MSKVLGFYFLYEIKSSWNSAWGHWFIITNYIVINWLSSLCCWEILMSDFSHADLFSMMNMQNKKSETFPLVEVLGANWSISSRKSWETRAPGKLIDTPNSVQLASDWVEPTHWQSRIQVQHCPSNHHKCGIFIQDEFSKRLSLFIPLLRLSDILCGTEFWSPDYIYSTHIVEHMNGSQAVY